MGGEVSDIVERLRSIRGPRFTTQLEAADEIERLRDDRNSWADQADARVKDCVEYLSEIERLRAALEAISIVPVDVGAAGSMRRIAVKALRDVPDAD